jgi:hypothetical protein
LLEENPKLVKFRTLVKAQIFTSIKENVKTTSKDWGSVQEAVKTCGTLEGDMARGAAATHNKCAGRYRSPNP